MEDTLDLTKIKKHFDSILKRYEEIQSAMQQSFDSEIALIKNQHHSELENVRTEQSEKNERIIFEKESEIADLKNLHNLDVAVLKQQHQYELVKLKKETNKKPKVTKISSEETTKTSDIK